jgi:hypothetical protein
MAEEKKADDGVFMQIPYQLEGAKVRHIVTLRLAPGFNLASLGDKLTKPGNEDELIDKLVEKHGAKRMSVADENGEIIPGVQTFDLETGNLAGAAAYNGKGRMHASFTLCPKNQHVVSAHHYDPETVTKTPDGKAIAAGKYRDPDNQSASIDWVLGLADEKLLAAGNRYMPAVLVLHPETAATQRLGYYPGGVHRRDVYFDDKGALKQVRDYNEKGELHDPAPGKHAIRNYENGNPVSSESWLNGVCQTPRKPAAVNSTTFTRAAIHMPRQATERPVPERIQNFIRTGLKPA